MPVQSFTAVCNAQTHTLVLGSMPGKVSLQEQEYYAHKRNGFWPIMLALVQNTEPNYEAHQQATYLEKLSVLQSAGIGLWDVLAACERDGSLDADIKSDSIVMNDFVLLFKQCTELRTIAFNGKTAERLYYRHVPKVLEAANVDFSNKRFVCLPSSSPALASLSLEEKYDQWKELLEL